MNGFRAQICVTILYNKENDILDPTPQWAYKYCRGAVLLCIIMVPFCQKSIVLVGFWKYFVFEIFENGYNCTVVTIFSVVTISVVTIFLLSFLVIKNGYNREWLQQRIVLYKRMIYYSFI